MARTVGVKYVVFIATTTVALTMGVSSQASAAPSGSFVRSDRATAPVALKSGTVTDANGRVVGGWKDVGVPGGMMSPSRASSDTYNKEYVGNGIWEYGTYFDNGGNTKHCWSKYYNQYNTHSATAQMNYTLKVYADAFSHADAHISQNAVTAQICRVFWSN